MGEQGSLEVASCSYKILTTHVISFDQWKLILWSDNCGAQNKNQFSLAMSLSLIAKGYFDVITHKFPISGYTYLSCDREFMIIEKLKKVSSPQVPLDIAGIIGSAKVTNPFLVCLTTEFCNWKQRTHKNLKISQASKIQVTKEGFGHVGVHLGHTDVHEWMHTNVLKPEIDMNYFKIWNVAFSETPKPLSEAKKNGLRAMFKS